MIPRPLSTGGVRRALTGLGALTLGAVCCAGVPLITALASAWALGIVVSVGTAVVLLAVIASALTISARRRRDGTTPRAWAGIRTSAAPTPPDEATREEIRK